MGGARNTHRKEKKSFNLTGWQCCTWKNITKVDGTDTRRGMNLAGWEQSLVAG